MATFLPFRSAMNPSSSPLPSAGPPPPPPAALLTPVLADVRLEQPVRPVVADDVLDRQFVPRRGPERLNRVHAAAIARDRQNRLVRQRRLDADGAGQAEAERAAARLEE